MDVLVTIAELKGHLTALGYAESTIEGYRRGLDQFKGFLERIGITDLRKVTRKTLEDYREEVFSEPIAAESKALKIRPVKRFFEHLVSTNRLLVNPAEGLVETSRRHKTVGPVLNVAEVEKLLGEPNLSLKTGIRDRAILEVLYATGIRLGELLGLEVHHVDLEDKVVTVRKGKGRRQRVVPLTRSGLSSLREYLEKVRPYHAKKAPSERRLFLNHSGRPLTPECVRVLIRKYRVSAGIGKPVSPHTLRRTVATHLLSQGVDIRYIQKLLGHERIKTTQAYTKVIPVDVKKTHDKTHPGKDL